MDYLKKCINNNSDPKCYLIFNDPKIKNACYGISKKDLCFYKAAEINQNPSYCEKISDDNLKQKCEEEAFTYG